MELNLETKQQLEKLLAKPVLVTEEHIPLLQNLIKAYPYYQPLYLLLAKAGFGTNGEQGFLAKAALYNNGNILHQIIHEPQKLKAIPDLNVINYQPWSLNDNLVIEEVYTTSPIKNVVVADTINEDLDQLNEEENTESISEISEDKNIEPTVEQEIETPTLDEAEADTVEEEYVDENDTLAEAEEPEKTSEEVEIPPFDNEEAQAVEHIEEEVDENDAAVEIEEQEKPTEEVEIPLVNNDEAQAVEQIEEEVGENDAVVEIKEPSDEVEEELTDSIEEQHIDEKTIPFVLPEIENLAPLESELLKIGIVVDQSTYESIAEQASYPLIDEQEKDEQETFEEVGELVAQETVENTTNIIEADQFTDAQNEGGEIENTSHDELHALFVSDEVEPVTTPEYKIEELAIENIANTDFFAFESNLSSEAIQSVEEDKNKGQRPEPITETKTAAQNSENIISKYDDDKLPFTFVWWLQKTRKDHEQIFRPFVSAAKSDSPIADLQQQYVENIFHLQSPLDVNPEEESVSNTQKANTKGNGLVDKFIKDDPQIKVPKPDQINNVNKAKKSAVDNYDVVSETLADIYIEQMLYHKAIDTYQKLSLKFPEKSRYFADLILSLEKKI